MFSRCCTTHCTHYLHNHRRFMGLLGFWKRCHNKTKVGYVTHSHIIQVIGIATNCFHCGCNVQQVATTGMKKSDAPRSWTGLQAALPAEIWEPVLSLATRNRFKLMFCQLPNAHKWNANALMCHRRIAKTVESFNDSWTWMSELRQGAEQSTSWAQAAPKQPPNSFIWMHCAFGLWRHSCSSAGCGCLCSKTPNIMRCKDGAHCYANTLCFANNTINL